MLMRKETIWRFERCGKSAVTIHSSVKRKQNITWLFNQQIVSILSQQTGLLWRKKWVIIWLSQCMHEEKELRLSLRT